MSYSSFKSTDKRSQSNQENCQSTGYNIGLNKCSISCEDHYKLELMTDVDMYQFIEKDMRGEISYIANRRFRANKKYMQDYDKNQSSKYIAYLDANNLNGSAMSQYLPTGKFKWMKQEQIDQLNFAKYKDSRKNGLILEVDLEYPKELHDLHNDYPLAAYIDFNTVERTQAERSFEKDFFKLINNSVLVKRQKI